MQQQTSISPEHLGQLIAQVSLSNEDKKYILNSLPYLNSQAINKLYWNLIELYKTESKIINQVQHIDLKYSMILKNELDKLDDV